MARCGLQNPVHPFADGPQIQAREVQLDAYILLSLPLGVAPARMIRSDLVAVSYHSVKLQDFVA